MRAIGEIGVGVYDCDTRRGKLEGLSRPSDGQDITLTRYESGENQEQAEERRGCHRGEWQAVEKVSAALEIVWLGMFERLIRKYIGSAHSSLRDVTSSSSPPGVEFTMKHTTSYNGY